MSKSMGVLVLACSAALLLSGCTSEPGPTAAGFGARAGAAEPPTADQVCGTEFVSLYGITASIEDRYLSTRDRSGLLQKVAEAAEKARLDKLADANQKLTDYGNKVLSLRSGAKPKMEAGTADALLAELNAVLLCLGLEPFDG